MVTYSTQQYAKPTQTWYEYWIYATFGLRVDNPSKVGKWCLFVPGEYIDDAWEQIQEETICGRLTFCAKTSTIASSGSKSSYVICVYTPDYQDLDDVMRVRKVLRDLGFEKPMPYKTDIETLKRSKKCMLWE